MAREASTPREGAEGTRSRTSYVTDIVKKRRTSPVFVALLTLACAVPSTPSAARAGGAYPQPSSPPSPVTLEAAPSRNAGQIDGRVAEIDYHSGRMTVVVPWPSGRKDYDVLVQPGTSISGPSKSFYEIADIKKGAHVEVLMSQKAGTYIAQIIHLL